METDEVTRLVDGIYKNILDKFNPGARQMINAGKAYLKSLHGAAAASRLYVDAITKLSRQAQQGTWGGSSDIGNALMQVVEVYKEIQAQQMNILKAFYVDLLVPLETNLEKDTKVVQSEQKKFLQQHKARSESYSKAATNMKKQRKKGTKGAKAAVAMDKELKNMQLLEEEKSKLDAFCEQSLKNAMTQERRRYGFVLERHCSLAKHYLAYHNAGSMAYTRSLEEWQEVAKSREYLPESVENMFATKLRAVSFWRDEDPSGDDDRISVASQLRKTKSMDASCLDIRSIGEAPSPMKPLSRAKSEFNLNSSSLSLAQDDGGSPHPRPKSMAIPDKSTWDSPLARALYAYLSSGENQLSFLEGDVIALVGERTKGWQFGENLRTQCSGWFPLAYTEMILDDSICSPTLRRGDSAASTATTPGTPGFNSTSTSGKPSPTTMFGDTLNQRKVAVQIHHVVPVTTYASTGPPPSHVAPTPGAMTVSGGMKRAPPLPPLPPLPLHLTGRRGGGKPGSLHSSNDSGFSNDPPPQPEADYSDDETARKPPPSGKELVSSVRGWLLYKSAMDLWEDVTKPEDAPQGTLKHNTVTRTKSAPKSGTLGRYNSQDLLQPTPVALESKPVKRSKSLWRFRNKRSDILEGMSLWKHRSLIDVNEPVNVDETPADETEKKSHDCHDTDDDIDHVIEEENIYSSAEELKPDDIESVIVVNDHATMDSSNILPRTKLIKSNSHDLGNLGPKKREIQTWNPARVKEAMKWSRQEGILKYGPWYDLWGLDASVKS